MSVFRVEPRIDGYIGRRELEDVIRVGSIRTKEGGAL